MYGDALRPETATSSYLSGRLICFWITLTVKEVMSVGPLDNRLGAFLTVSEMAIFGAIDAVEITLPDRDNFGTAVTFALILLPRRAPLRHWFVPHCPCVLSFCPKGSTSLPSAFLYGAIFLLNIL